MSNRPNHIHEIPCFRCEAYKECEDKIARSPKLGNIRDNVFVQKDFEVENCELFKAIMMEAEEVSKWN